MAGAMWPCKLWVLALAVAAAAGAKLTGELAELAAALRDSCVEDTGVDAALLDAVDEGAELPPDGRFKCYLQCTMDAAGYMADGAVDVDLMLELLPPEIGDLVAATVRSCGTLVGGDDCETAYLTQQCWQANNKENYFLV